MQIWHRITGVLPSSPFCAMNKNYQTRISTSWRRQPGEWLRPRSHRSWMAVEQIKLQDTTVLYQAQLQLLSISISFPRKSVKQENKFKLPLYSNTGFNDQVEIQILILQFCFSSRNIIWETLDTLHKTKQSCFSGPSRGPVVNSATYCFLVSKRKEKEAHITTVFLLYWLWNSYSPIYFNTDLKSKCKGRMTKKVECNSSVPFPIRYIH